MKWAKGASRAAVVRCWAPVEGGGLRRTTEPNCGMRKEGAGVSCCSGELTVYVEGEGSVFC